MFSYFQAIILGALQGLSELFPVSSLGHSVILPSLFGWNIDQHDNAFLLFLVATHFATAAVLFVFFWKDWLRIIKGFFRSLVTRKIKNDVDAKLAWLLIIATIPAGLLGLLFEKKLKLLLATASFTAFILILNGLMLFLAEHLRKKDKSGAESHSYERMAKLSWLGTLKVGILQTLALIPGFSRTGSTITGGLWAGLSHEDAAHFSFLLATPIIAAAAILKLPHLLKEENASAVGPILVGTACSAIAAYLTVRFLTRYFKTKTLRPFAIYCVIAGIISSLILFLR